MLKIFSEYKNKLILLPIVFILITPILTVFSYLLHPSTELWEHLANNLLIPHIENTYELDIVKDREIIMPILTQWIRNMYYSEYPLPGDTIEMIEMEGADPDPILPGTKGIVDHIKTLRFGDGYEEHVDVNWENGRTLKLILPGDEIKIIS